MLESKEIIIERVTKVLKDEGLYSSILDFAIENYAQSCYLKSIAYEDAIGFSYGGENKKRQGRSRSVVIESSREGDKRFKVNPAHSIFLEHLKESQKVLDSLCMTAKSSSVSQDDDFDILKDKMKKAAGDE